MKVTGMTLTAALVMAATGCTSDAEPVAQPPTVPATPSVTASPPVTASPSAYAQPPGRTCTEIGAEFSKVMGVTWKVGSSSLGRDRDAAKTGTRKCEAEASSTDHSPPAILSVLLFRPDPDLDTPERMLAAVQRRDKQQKCTTELSDPPDGVGYATRCVQNVASTLTSASTTLLLESGWVMVHITGQHQTSDAAAEQARTFVAKASRDGAVSAISMI
jgi:hypothetical protein